MPKSSSRCKHWRSPSSCPSDSSSAPVAIHSGSLLFSTPRKVSFEESRSDSNSSFTIESTPQTPSEGLESVTNHPLSRKRSLLVRPTTSLSLVDLVNSSEEVVSTPSLDKTLHEEQGERTAKRMCSPAASPRSTLPVSQLKTHYVMHSLPTEAQEEMGSPKSSPWGQFVDMLVPEDENRSSSHHCYTDYACSCCCESSSRSRRSIPYGIYKKNPSRTRRMLAPPSSLHLHESTFTNPFRSKFRLVPRKERNQNTEQLVGAFSGLNF